VRRDFLPQRSVQFVKDHLAGERNGKRTGVMLNTAEKNAEEIKTNLIMQYQ